MAGRKRKREDKKMIWKGIETGHDVGSVYGMTNCLIDLTWDAGYEINRADITDTAIRCLDYDLMMDKREWKSMLSITRYAIPWKALEKGVGR
jgi:hypothetical protein